jgi:hypothetical protein
MAMIMATPMTAMKNSTRLIVLCMDLSRVGQAALEQSATTIAQTTIHAAEMA